MSIMNCPDCGGMVSDKAVTCPHCGCPMTSKENCSNKDVADNICKGFTYIARKEDKIVLECNNCQKRWSFRNSAFSTIIGTASVISAKQIICPNCKNTLAAEERISRRRNEKDIDGVGETVSLKEENIPKEPKPEVQSEKGIGCGTQILIALVVLFLIGMLFSGESTYEKTGRSAFDKLEDGKIESMTDDEWGYIFDVLEWEKKGK